MLADKVGDLNLLEMRYFYYLLDEKVAKSTGLSPMKLNLDWPSIKQDNTGTWPPANPNWFKQQELMSSLGPFMGMMGGGGAAPAQGAAGGQAAPAEAEEEKPAAEKTHFDVELQAFDAATKIKLIKEVRALLGLGLKEAKETVETAPSWLKKDLKKEEAEEMKTKLEGLGATIRLA